MRGRAILLGLALGLAACGGTQPVHKKLVPVVLPKVAMEARAFFEEGVRLMRAGPASLEPARDQFGKAIDVDDKFFEAWHDLGVVEARLGRWNEAIAALRKALKLQPASRRTLVALAELHGRVGNWSEAQKLYADRLSADPKDADLRLRYIQALREGGKSAEALEVAKGMLAEDSKSAAAFNALGLVYLRMEKTALAESAFRRAVELDPKGKSAAAAWNNLGLVALAKGRDQEAFAAFEKASALDGGFREAHLNRANVYLDCGDYKRAEREVRKAIDIDGDDPDAHVALGVALRGQKRFDEARESYERALGRRPNHPAALYALGILYMDFQPDKAKARESLTLFRKIAPSDDPRRADAASRLKELK